MIWLILTVWVLTLGFATGFFLKKWFPKVGWTIVAVTALLMLIIGICVGICWAAPKNDPGLEPDYAILLGCGLEEGQAPEEMVRRCRKALAWMEENPKSYLVVAGGDPESHGVTEAAVMAAWLRNHGVDAKWILLEDQSVDTRENLVFSKALAEELGLETDTIMIITSEYHQTRARFLAEKNGQQALSLSCRTPLPEHLFAAVREVYAFIKAFFETL